MKKLFEKYINDKISESKFYELDKSYDDEKSEIKARIKTIEDELNRVNLQINDISTFYLMISKHKKIDMLSRDKMISFVLSTRLLSKREKDPTKALS